jgi:hypothetical protein
MERFAANMPVVAGLELRGNPRYPKISRWYSAMDSRPAYQKVKSDDMTLNLVIRCVHCADFVAWLVKSQKLKQFCCKMHGLVAY